VVCPADQLIIFAGCLFSRFQTRTVTRHPRKCEPNVAADEYLSRWFKVVADAAIHIYLMNPKEQFGQCTIKVDPLEGIEVATLLAEHLEGMAYHSPPENIHALDLDGLKAPDITFWTAWKEGELMGCGALRELDSKHGEIKSMRTARRFLGMGVGSAILGHIIAVSRSRAYTRLSLETGSGTAFEAAHSLYRKYGFQYCGPFGDYLENPFSRFMTLPL
jgi:putative acetyltransferase